MNRDELLSRIDESRARFDAAMQAFMARGDLARSLPNGWTIKDLLAHLAHWEARQARIYQTLASGGTPTVDVTEATIDDYNARVQAQWKDRTYEDVRAAEQEAYQAIRAVVEMAPEGDLFNADRFTFTKGQPYANWIVWDTYEHYDEHAGLFVGAG